MPESLVDVLSVIVQVLEVCGAGFLIIGFSIDTVRWVKAMSKIGQADARHKYRRRLGRSILIGLDLLVAATIIQTVIVTPSVEGVGVLALMVLIRTFLGWTIALEINGRWPWQTG